MSLASFPSSPVWPPLLCSYLKHPSPFPIPLITCILLSPSLELPTSWSLSTSLLFSVIPNCTLTSKDSGVGPTNKREHAAFVFVDLGYLLHCHVPVPTIHLYISFFFTSEWYSIVYVYCIFIIHLSIEGHLDCFHFLAISIRTSMSLAEQVFVEWAVKSSGLLPRSDIAQSYGRFLFSFLTVLHIAFQSDCTSLHSHH